MFDIVGVTFLDSFKLLVPSPLSRMVFIWIVATATTRRHIDLLTVTGIGGGSG